MNAVVIYSTAYCPYCVRAKELLRRKNIEFTDIRVDEHPERREEMLELSQRWTVPQIFINGQPIGGCDELYALEHQGKLDQLLRGNRE